MMEKLKGELAEAKFLTEALSKGFIVSKPFGDSCEYDFIIDYNGKLNKIQIKSIWTLSESKDRYTTKIGKTTKKIKYDLVDFCGIFVLNTWYFIPIKEVDGINVCVYPHRDSNGKYEAYKNNWQILK